MKKWLVVIFATLVLTSPALADSFIKWHPVCRHNAVYWAVTVGEQFPTRIMYGWFVDKVGIKYYHVQPQMYLGEKWWYFKVEDDTVKIITKPVHRIYYVNTNEWEDTEWRPQFVFPTLQKYLEYLDELLVKGPDACEGVRCFGDEK